MVRGDGLLRMGDREAANVAFRKAVTISNDDPAVLMQLAEFLCDSGKPADQDEAERLLRGIVGQYDPARRRLADMLVARGGEAEWAEAQRLLELSADNSTAIVDRIAQVRSLLNRRGAENLAKAATICQTLLAEPEKNKQLLPGVHVLLAEIRERQDNSEEARKQYRAAIDREHPSAAQLAVYVDFLLRHGPAEEADQVLKQLEKLQPESLVAVQPRARWLHDQKRIGEIEPLVEGVAEKLLGGIDKNTPGLEAQFDRAIGDLYDGVEQNTAAERWYRKSFKFDPNTYERLALSLAKQGRIQDAVAMCEEAGKTDTSAKPALVMTFALILGRATAGDLATAEPYLKKALETHKDQPALLANMANIRVRQEKAGDAIELYRQILAIDPKNVEVLNNLATMLAEQPESEKRKEALEFVDRAINLAGPQPGLLDTKGMILYFIGKPDLALAALEEAVQTPSPDPRCWLHLAVVREKLGQLDQARAALKQARAGDLERQLLTKMDRQLLADLAKRLG